ncbi:MAG: LLM class flavin-dependent oxidoreductase [Conexivisphaerales archaeon]
MTERLALLMSDKNTIREEIDFARYAEQQGFESLWFGETRLAREAIVPMAAVAACTEKIKLGTGVVNNWTRNVGLMALTFTSLYDLAPNRIILGIGAWWEPLASKLGVKRVKPLKAMREYVTTLKRLFTLRPVTYHGEFVNVEDVMIDIEYGDMTARNVPVYIGATGFKMLELAGEIGDGVVLNYLVSPDYNLQAVEAIKKGAKKVGRRLDNIERPQLIVVSMDYDIDRAMEISKKYLALYLGQEPHLMKASGVPGSLIKDINEALGGWPAKPGGLERAKELVPDQIIDTLTVTGTPEDCRRKVKKYIETGATVPIMYSLGDVNLLIREMSKGYL